VPAVPQVKLTAQWSPLRRVGFEALALIPTTAATAAAPEGVIDLRILALEGGLTLALTDPSENLSLSGAVGMGAMLLFFHGDAAPPWRTARGSRWVASPYAGIAARYRLQGLHSMFLLRGDVLVADREQSELRWLRRRLHGRRDLRRELVHLHRQPDVLLRGLRQHEHEPAALRRLRRRLRPEQALHQRRVSVSSIGPMKGRVAAPAGEDGGAINRS
jgi:hypothetical protein